MPQLQLCHVVARRYWHSQKKDTVQVFMVSQQSSHFYCFFVNQKINYQSFDFEFLGHI